MRHNRINRVEFGGVMLPELFLNNLRRATHLYHENLLEGNKYVIGTQQEMDDITGFLVTEYVEIDFVKSEVTYYVRNDKGTKEVATLEFLRSEVDSTDTIIEIGFFVQECLDI